MNIPYLHCSDTKLLLQVKSDLDRHEGFREFAYPDPLSKIAKTQKSKHWGYKPARDIVKPGTNMDDGAPWTYGYGFTKGVGPDSRINKIQAERMLEQLILELDAQLKNVLFWFSDASFVTRTVLINMGFNLGLRGLLKFRNTLTFIKEKNYQQAAKNMTLSLWYKQVGARAKELAQRMKTQTIEAAHAAPEKV